MNLIRSRGCTSAHDRSRPNLGNVAEVRMLAKTLRAGHVDVTKEGHAYDRIAE